MKKNKTVTLALIALVLTMVTTQFVSGTYAKYVTTVTGTDTFTVAKWAVVLKQGDHPITAENAFNLWETIEDNDDVVDKRIAPGTKGSFAIEYDTTGTEVDHSIVLTLDFGDGAKHPENFTYTVKDGETVVELAGEPAALPAGWTKEGTLWTFEKSVLAATNGATAVLTVDWEWPFETGAVDDGIAAGDADDTAAGVAANEFDVTVTLTVTQVDNDPVPEP